MSFKSIKAAIIGCGRVAWMLEDDPLDTKPCTHMGAYRSFDAGVVEVIAASDTNNERLRTFGERYGVEGLYSDYRTMLKEEGPEIVSICAWATDRHRMALDAMEAGVKGIWCEKALATSLDEAREIAEASEAKGVAMIVSHLRRWSGEYNKAREIIDDNGIGTLQSIVCHFSGSLLHTGTHAFDILLWFLGPAEWVMGEIEKAAGKNDWETPEDSGGRAFIQFRNGAYATIHAEAKAYFFFEFDIIGSNGRIRIGNNGVLEYYIPKDSRYYTGLKELYAETFPEFEQGNIWTEALGNLINSVNGIEASRNTPRDGYMALELALAIHESSRSGDKVYIPLRESKIKVRSR
ncbi:MAG: Gfo/Idh/MocA family oxidoreductase [Deltaproteobacteria bacterium]|nr:Gfo/Idh/MocA family oxidoreductase [Deltaproteobacteria bacterium]